MSAAHTPGPWRIRENTRNDPETCDLSICGDIFVLADLTGPQYAHQLPNARLIAAAPDLLDALRKAVKWLAICDDARCEKDFIAAEAAIAKALGR